MDAIWREIEAGGFEHFKQQRADQGNGGHRCGTRQIEAQHQLPGLHMGFRRADGDLADDIGLKPGFASKGRRRQPQ